MDTGPRKQGPRVPVDSTTDVPFRRSGALPDPLRRLLFLIVPSLAILTPSYAPDFALCRELNESVLQWSPSSVVHHIVVPGRDRAVFEPLRSPRTEIWSVDHFLPRRMVGVPKANMWLNVRRPFPPVRGWIMQQVMKLCAAAELGADVTILVDSDVLFVRPIKLETFQQGTKLRFYKKPEAIDVTLPRHLVWHNVARDMLGLPPAGRPPLPDYVGPLHAWDRKVVTALRDRIEYVAGRPWAHVIASRVHFSEWILYGIFVDEILGTEARVSEVESTLCRTYFDAAPLDDEATERFVAGLAPDDVAISISAKSRPSLAGRRRALARMSSVVEAPAS